MSRQRKPQADALAGECIATAHAIAGALAAIDHEDSTLTGVGGALLLFDVLAGEGPKLPRTTAARWEAAVVASVEHDEASFPDGMLGSAWLLARRGGHQALLRSVDDAVLDALAEAPWPGALGLNGGLGGFALYGLARRTSRATEILDRCVAHAEQLASRRPTRWLPGHAVLPPTTRARVRLLNMDGSAAAIAMLVALAPRVPRALALARNGARTLVADLEAASNRGIGEWTASASVGLVHGNATWSLGGAGVAAALGSVARVSRGARELAAATRFGRALAGVSPESCNTADASLASGTAGVAVVLDALADTTREPSIRWAADYWIRRTLRCRGTEGVAGYRFFAPMRNVVEGGSRWLPRPGLLDGASGTALALLVAARHPRARACRQVLGVS